MNRKDYIEITKVLNYQFTISTNICKERVRSICISLASTFGMENQRFDRDRFLKACGVEL